MKAVIPRTNSGTFSARIISAPASPRLSISIPPNDSVAGGDRKNCCSLHLASRDGRRGIRRVSSLPEVSRPENEISGGMKSLSKFGSRSRISDQEDEGRIGSLTLQGKNRGCAEGWPESGIQVEEVGFPGGGSGKKLNSGGGGGDFGNRIDMGAYYRQLLKLDPTNSLFLVNYGKYLHEVERDWVKAEEYYGRAILANPGDGEVLSLYGKLIWESCGDGNRAKSYFDKSVQASPDDCMILGSYAHFMWETEGEDDAVERENATVPAAMVEAF